MQSKICIVVVANQNYIGQKLIDEAYMEDGGYAISFNGNTFLTSTADGYPAKGDGDGK